MNHATQSEARPYRGTEHLTESEYHKLLAADQRRTVLEILETSTLPIELDELALFVAASEYDLETIDQETITHVTLHLHHTHLPKMDDLGVIDYDPITRLSMHP